MKFSLLVVIFIFSLTDHLFGEQSTQINKGKSEIKIQDRWIAIDKLQHFSYSFLVSLGVQYILVNKIKLNENRALPYSSFVSFSAGLAKEINDNKGRNGYFSHKDMIANCVGIFFAVAVVNVHPVDS